MLPLVGITLKGKCRTWLIPVIGSFRIDAAFSKNLSNLFFCNMAAFHPATGMKGIFQPGVPVQYRRFID
jgi:hypothetical protein